MTVFVFGLPIQKRCQSVVRINYVAFVPYCSISEEAPQRPAPRVFSNHFHGTHPKNTHTPHFFSSLAMTEDTGKTHQRNFIFGYGSLICPESRKQTNPTLANQDALPVIVQNVERVWSARTQMYTAMGVQFRRDAECTGVLLEVNKMELKDLDEREKLYDRCSLELQTIQQVSFLEQELFYREKEHPVFVAKANNNNNINQKKQTK